jgi:hypothetical protein
MQLTMGIIIVLLGITSSYITIMAAKSDDKMKLRTAIIIQAGYMSSLVTYIVKYG